MARHVERQPEATGIPAEERPRQNQVARTRHRQELRESLHDAEQRRAQQIHGGGYDACRPAFFAAVDAPPAFGLSMIAIAAAMNTVE